MSYLLHKYGDHAQLHVVYNPDDFRQAYVYEGDDFPLVTLTHEHVRASTPAWTFTDAKAKFDSGMENWAVPDDKTKFLNDIDDAVTKKGKTGKTRSKREQDKATVRQAKNQSAVQHAVNYPLSSSGPFGPEPSANPHLPPIAPEPVTASYDDAPLMPIVNRTTGEKLL